MQIKTRQEKKNISIASGQHNSNNKIYRVGATKKSATANTTTAITLWPQAQNGRQQQPQPEQ